MKYAALVLLLAMSCTTARPPRSAPSPQPGPDLVFHVYVHGQQPEAAVNGCVVTAIGHNGEEIILGKTFGSDLRVSKAKLQEMDARVLLFCGGPLFECVALKVAEQQLYAYDEYYVDLPLVILR